MICSDTAEYAIDKLYSVAKDHPSPSTVSEDCWAFSKQVTFVEGIILSTYGVAVRSARREPDAANLVEMWGEFQPIVEKAISALFALKQKYPYCGTPELYDRMMDLRDVVVQKLRDLKQEIECPVNLPDALFP